MNHDVKQYYSGRVREKDRSDFLWQVGKTVDGEEVAQKQVDLIVKTVKDRLDLSQDDLVLDVGCGNGLLTKRVSEFAKEVTGIELTQELYEIALDYNNAKNIRYINKSIFDIDTAQYGGKYTKVYLYEVVQHFSVGETDRLIDILKSLTNEKAIIFLGGILDIEKRWSFFDTDERRRRYFDSVLSGADPLGTWYYKDYFKYLAEKQGLLAECYPQNSELYTRHYRFDCVMRKK